ncbi:MAG: crotonase/enoyl-CoA hydratase family protein [Hyphomicrobiaceae bacterium]|nr:crotonase/enoyl-CoA hydratase family protein [Hyphomicrobiaceae bacterium]
MADEILIQRLDEVQLIRINRPEKKNALTRAMYDTMTAALRSAEADNTIAVNVIAGTGGVFCAGNDIVDFARRATDLDREGGASSLIGTLPTLDKPLIAAVDGLAIGVGVTMLFHCDLVYAAPRASFRTPFLDLGLVMEAASSYLAPAIMGHQRAFELLCLGEPFDAEAAVRAGFVNRVVPAEDLEAEALKSASRLAARPRRALIAAKRLMKRGVRERAAEQMKVEGGVFAELLGSSEAREAFAAFLEKRKPDFAKARSSGTDERN